MIAPKTGQSLGRIALLSRTTNSIANSGARPTDLATESSTSLRKVIQRYGKLHIATESSTLIATRLRPLAKPDRTSTIGAAQSE
jgi:hypothetical protein